jgi:hypothetical protein
MRYLVASGIACLVVCASLAYHWWVTSMFATIMEQARVRAGLPPGSPMNDLGLQVTGRQMLSIELDHFLLKFWFVLLPVLLLICFGIAAALPPARSTAGMASDKMGIAHGRGDRPKLAGDAESTTSDGITP